MSRNRRGPGLLRTAARTAVISSTATATSRSVSNAMDQKAARLQREQAAVIQSQADVEQMKTQLAALQSTQDQAALPVPATAPVAQTDLLTQLTQLSQLKETGALSEAEFQLAKAKLLN